VSSCPEEKRLVDCCGIECSDCPVYKATQRDNDEERSEILRRQREKWASIFSEQYGREYSAEDINCDGCNSNSDRVFWFCRDCGIRRCAQEKELANCAFCQDYSCDKLENLFEKSRAPASETLEQIREGCFDMDKGSQS
jgi:hypothetical protein